MLRSSLKHVIAGLPLGLLPSGKNAVAAKCLLRTAYCHSYDDFGFFGFFGFFGRLGVGTPFDSGK